MVGDCQLLVESLAKSSQVATALKGQMPAVCSSNDHIGQQHHHNQNYSYCYYYYHYCLSMP
jgi:hypothetical protein